MTPKELLEKLNKMEPLELENTMFDVIAFDIQDVDWVYSSLCNNVTIELDDKKYENLSNNDKLDLIKKALNNKEVFGDRNQYIYSVQNVIEEDLIKRCLNENYKSK
jgi:hypothetical protein